MAQKKTAFNFQKAYTKLEALVDAFEAGDLSLDEGLKKFEEGLALAKQIKAKLASVENSIEEIKERFDADTERE